jgi:hypothetical protein
MLHVGGALVELWKNGATTSIYHGVGAVSAVAHDTDEYRARAQSLGYGSDTARMSREHELTHHLLADLLGLPYSPTLHGVAAQKIYERNNIEEAAVLAIQAFARAVDVDLVEIALKKDAERSSRARIR